MPLQDQRHSAAEFVNLENATGRVTNEYVPDSFPMKISSLDPIEHILELSDLPITLITSLFAMQPEAFNLSDTGAAFRQQDKLPGARIKIPEQKHERTTTFA